MEKVLRSLIHEKFDLETRVELELLSRRRDINNKEKHEEIIKLLQSKNIPGLVPLGPGTNRFAVKIDGFVVKIATDHDGIIDNKKEFKMAKRLYPHVTKIYEVSENGTLLVAEYIQPFASFTEMCRYSERIKEILRELSSVYLIGDVGITPVNFANWGLRVGDDKEPVCLDFAYVYEVSSELFTCRYCNTNSMLIPNSDFTDLYCVTCGKKYVFEDIRNRIGNDEQAHEIGDLSTEGYRLFNSHIPTELTPERSNYLMRKKNKKSKHKEIHEEEPVREDNFIMDWSGISHQEGRPHEMDGIKIVKAKAYDLSQKPMPDDIVIQARATVIGPAPVKEEKTPPIVEEKEADPIPVVGAKIITDDEVEEAQEDNNVVEEAGDPDAVAFTEDLSPAEDKDDMTVPSNEDSIFTSPWVEANDRALEGDMDPPIRATAEIITKEEPKKIDLIPHVDAEVVSVPLVEMPEDEEEKETSEESDDGLYEFDKQFLISMRDAVSLLSNRIGYQLIRERVFFKISNSFKDKRYHMENFNKALQSAVFRSLVKFLGFTEITEPKYGGGKRHIFTPPKDPHGVYEPTLRFIEALCSENMFDAFGQEQNLEMLMDYRRNHDKYLGIQMEWIPFLKDRIKTKMNLDPFAIQTIVDTIVPNWCTDEDFTKKEEVEVKVPSKSDNRDIATQYVANVFDNYSEESESKLYEFEVMGDNDAIIVKRALIKFTERHFNQVGVVPDMSNKKAILLVSVNLSVNKVGDMRVEGFQKFIDIEEMEIYDMMNIVKISTGEKSSNKIGSIKYDTCTDLVVALSKMDMNTIKAEYLDTINATINAVNEQIMQENAKTEALPPEDEDDELPGGFTEDISPSEAAEMILKEAAAEEEEDDDEDDGEEYEFMSELDSDDYETIRVHIMNDEEDIIRITSGEAFGPVNIPIYTRLADIPSENTVKSMVDDRNGVWDWMTHLVPDHIFKTTDPEKYMKINDYEPDVEQMKILILDNTNGVYTMGAFLLDGIFVVDEEKETPTFDRDLLVKLNNVIYPAIGYTPISHLKRSLTFTDLIRTEEYIQELIDSTVIDEDEEDEDPPTQLNVEEAALLAIIKNGSDALPEDATAEQKEFAEAISKKAITAFGIPASVASDDPMDITNEPGLGEAPGDIGVDSEEIEVEEEFEISEDQQLVEEAPKPEPVVIAERSKVSSEPPIDPTSSMFVPKMSRNKRREANRRHKNKNR